MTVKCFDLVIKNDIYGDYIKGHFNRTELATIHSTSRRTIGRVITEMDQNPQLWSDGIKIYQYNNNNNKETNNDHPVKRTDFKSSGSLQYQQRNKAA